MAAVRVAIYPINAGQQEELKRRVDDSLLGIYRDQAGFESLTVVDAGEEIVSISHWASKEHAQQGSEAVVAWVKEQEDLIPGPSSKTAIGEELLSA